MEYVTENTSVYFDPPYRPLNVTSGFTSKVLKKFGNKTVDIIFADPPYFLSNDGITCSRWKNGNSK